eukprot:m.161346 g.161346  ORF g.161346 m.161346 type:complete len:240 (-) comp31228_c0_seq1:46-765(-)
MANGDDTDADDSLAQFTKWIEPVGVCIYLAFCAIVYVNCNEVESRLNEKLRRSMYRHNNPEKAESESAFGTPDNSSALFKDGRPSMPKKRGKNVSSSRYGWGWYSTLKGWVMAVMQWLSTRTVLHYGKLEWRDITYLLWHDGNTDGLFLVSECISHDGCFELAVCVDGDVHRYLIRHDPKRFLYGIHDSAQFSDLYGVILHYRTRQNGLCCRLEKNAWRKNGMDMLAARHIVAKAPVAS